MFFNDAAGDVQGVPDITKVEVSNDSASKITLTISAAGIGQYLVDNADGSYYELIALFDTDRNPSAGSSDGFDSRFFAERDSQWQGSSAGHQPEVPDRGHRDHSDQHADLGDTTSFAFTVAVASVDASAGQTSIDLAPDASPFGYTLDLTPVVVKPPLGTVHAVPAHPVAGKSFSISVPVTRSDDGTALAQASVNAQATVQGKHAPVRTRYADGNATVSLTVPHNASGKLLKLMLTVSSGGQTSTRLSSFQIR